jgi:hypothetical protein
MEITYILQAFRRVFFALFLAFAHNASTERRITLRSVDRGSFTIRSVLSQKPESMISLNSVALPSNTYTAGSFVVSGADRRMKAKKDKIK